MPPVAFETRTNLFSTAYIQGFDGLVYSEAHGEADGSFRGYLVVAAARDKCTKKYKQQCVLECEASNQKVLFIEVAQMSF